MLVPKQSLLKSSVIKRSIVIAGHKTSVSIEDAFWSTLRDIARRQHMTLSSIVSGIDLGRRQRNLSSAIRLFVLDYMRARTVVSQERPAADMLNGGMNAGGPYRS